MGAEAAEVQELGGKGRDGEEYDGGEGCKSGSTEEHCVSRMTLQSFTGCWRFIVSGIL